MLKLDRPALDWLTLTTFHRETGRRFHNLIASSTIEHRDARHRQYEGVQSDEGFTGTATQNGQPHYLLQLYGEFAALYWRALAGPETRATRLDVQLTVDMPRAYSARALADALRSGDWQRKRRVDLIDSEDALDTVYIGSRKSERLVRVYVKLAGDEERFLRFEVEYKGDLAQQAWKHLQSGTGEGVLLAGELELLPAEATGVLDIFRDKLGDGTILHPVRFAQDVNRTMTWFEEQVCPALQRLLNDHTTKARTQNILLDLMRG